MDSTTSIVIPCYNAGLFLPEALESLRVIPEGTNYEVIIVNDGSTDETTLNFLGSLSTNDYLIIHQENKGPAAARNTGVKASKGKYLLFLDSDNKIRPDYINKSIEILESNAQIGVVYGEPAFFGETTNKRFKSKDFDFNTILLSNYIDMCSIIRKQVWEELEGFDENRIIIGHEDWEFWIRVGAAGWKFHHINEVLFDYRIRNDSLVKQALETARHKQMLSYIHAKHFEIFMKTYNMLLIQFNNYQNEKKSPIRTFLRHTYRKYLKK